MTQQEPYRNRPYLVARAPFQRVVRDYLARMGNESYFDVGSRGQRSDTFESIGSGDELSPYSKYTQVALLIFGDDNELDSGKSVNLLGQFLTDGGHWVTFDKADKIITRLVGPMMWLCDPELNEIYENANLASLDIIHPTCEAAELEALGDLWERSERDGVEVTAKHYATTPTSVVRWRRQYRALAEAAA